MIEDIVTDILEGVEGIPYRELVDIMSREWDVSEEDLVHALDVLEEQDRVWGDIQDGEVVVHPGAWPI